MVSLVGIYKTGNLTNRPNDYRLSAAEAAEKLPNLLGKKIGLETLVSYQGSMTAMTTGIVCRTPYDSKPGEVPIVELTRCAPESGRYFVAAAHILDGTVQVHDLPVDLVKVPQPDTLPTRLSVSALQ